MQKIFLDDLQAVDVICNDLGLDANQEVAPDGYACAKWLVYESGLDLKSLEFKVHSANPVAAEQIKGLLINYIKYLKKRSLISGDSSVPIAISIRKFSTQFLKTVSSISHWI
jgi:hypothetical protein